VEEVQVVREVQGKEDDYKRVEGVRFREKPADLDIDDYFYDIVGVSLNPESEPERIVLKVGYPDAEYLNTKPLHGSQHLVERTNEGMTFELKVIPNEEFMQQLLTYMHNGEVVRPKKLKKAIYERAFAILEHNKTEK